MPQAFLFPFWLAEWKGINTGKSGFVCLSEASLEAGRIDALERRNPEGARQGYVSLPSFLSYNKKEGRLSGRDRTLAYADSTKIKRTQRFWRLRPCSARTVCLSTQA
jgi:hypothetical protein